MRLVAQLLYFATNQVQIAHGARADWEHRETTWVVLTDTFNFSARFWKPRSPLHMSRNRRIIISALEVFLSLGPFSCGVQVRCSAVVNHPPD